MISRFEHACGCAFTRNAITHSFEHTEACNEHGGGPLSFGGTRAAGVRHGGPVTHLCNESHVTKGGDPRLARDMPEHVFTFTKEELHWLLVTASTAHTELLLERRKCVQQRIDFNDQTMWVNRLREIDAEDPIIRSIVRKLERKSP